jgi:PAS domain S-box-containing protein
MIQADDEERLLRAVGIQNAEAILVARRRAEEELLRAKEALELRTRELAHSLAMARATLESTTDGILVTDAQGNVTDFNERFLSMWQLPVEAVASRRHRDIVEAVSPQVAELRPFVERIEAIYASWPEETFDVLELADGRVVERFSRVQLVESRNVGRVWSFRDITGHRRAEQVRKQAEETLREADRRKDEFLATLSHELRTPLTAMLGWVRLLRSSALDAATAERALEVLERNVKHQGALITDLLDVSRIVAGTMTLDVDVVDMSALVTGVVETMRRAAEAKGLALAIRPERVALPLHGDAERLRQVVTNLLSNAVKFTPEGGTVTVALTRTREHVRLTVSDTGRGIGAAFLPHVFERFRQADTTSRRMQAGLGLGLAIVRHIVELHGGQVRVHSDGEGTGATFTVDLPVALVADDARDEPVAATETAAAAARPLEGVKVLIVDDDTDSRELFEVILGQSGAAVTAAQSVGEALAAIRRVRPDVLVCDLAMPGADGFALIREVRSWPLAQGGAVPALALTAYARLEDRERALGAGFQLHLSKPAEPGDVVDAVASLARDRRAG